MMNEQTVTKMNELKLFGMAHSFAERIGKADHSDLSHSEFVGLLIDDEKTHRENRKMDQLLKNAKLKIKEACLEDIDYQYPRGISKQTILEFAQGAWLERKQNFLISGATGLGKTFISNALGNQACRAGYSTLYVRIPRLFEQLHVAKADGTHLNAIAKLSKINVLILDDFGFSPLTETERKDLLEIIEDRYHVGSVIMASQHPLKEFHRLMGEPTIADAICDRLFHNAYKLELKGDKSYRKEKSLPNRSQFIGLDSVKNKELKQKNCQQ